MSAPTTMVTVATLAQIHDEILTFSTTYRTPAEKARACRRLASSLQRESAAMVSEAEALERQARYCGGDEVERVLRPVMRPMGVR